MAKITRSKFKKSILGGFFLFLIALFFIEFSTLLIYLIFEGEINLSNIFNVSEFTIAIAFLWICLLRGTTLWYYKGWAIKQNIFHLKYHFNIKILFWILLSIIIAGIVNHGFSIPALNEMRILSYWDYFNRNNDCMLGVANFGLQYIYYILEGILMIFMIDAFQTAGEEKSNFHWIPWGGIVLAILWGASHYFTKGTSTMIWGIKVGIITGIIYLISKKNFWSPLIFWMSINIL